jgi:hypothetical protein
MTAKLDYRWHLRQVMATRNMFSTTDLLVPLADRESNYRLPRCTGWSSIAPNG